MKPTNLLFILSDEHSRRVLGCYGHRMIRTPNLDRLAARGVRLEPLPVRKAALRLASEAGPGNSNYQDYDDRITAAGVDWLKARAAKRAGKPWVLFVSLVCPHFPLIARPEWYGLYPEDKVPLPALYDPAERQAEQPHVAANLEWQIYDKGFDPASLRRAIAAYFGLVSFVDHNVGKLMAALAGTGLAADTR